MRRLLLPLILSLSALYSASAASPVDDYIAVRDAYQKEFKDRDIVGDEPARAAYERARADLEARLRGIVGPARIEGFPAEGKINLGSLSEGDEEFGRLDGLVYSPSDRKRSVVVTTDDLLDKWLAAHRTWWSGKDDMPPGVEAALKSEAFYTQALNTDAAFFKFVDLPLAEPAGATFAYAALVGRAQDYGLRQPNELIVVLRRGGRLFVVSAPAGATISAVPKCARSYEKAEKQARATAGDKSEQLAEEAYRAYRQCFAAQARSASYFPVILKQAQALVDTLPK
jgi:hypothetical protein